MVIMIVPIIIPHLIDFVFWGISENRFSSEISHILKEV